MYQRYRGTPQLLAALRRLLEATFMQASTRHASCRSAAGRTLAPAGTPVPRLPTLPPSLGGARQGVEVSTDNLTALAGAGSVIDALFHCIAGPGDGAPPRGGRRQAARTPAIKHARAAARVPASAQAARAPSGGQSAPCAPIAVRERRRTAARTTRRQGCCHGRAPSSPPTRPLAPQPPCSAGAQACSSLLPTIPPSTMTWGCATR